MAHILVVDDSKFNRGRLIAALQTDGHTIIEAENGWAALEQLAQPNIDLIISDLLMPGLDGFGLLKELQERRIDIPIIVISADIQTTSRERCQELGARKFLGKPCKPAEICQAVADLLPASVGSR